MALGSLQGPQGLGRGDPFASGFGGALLSAVNSNWVSTYNLPDVLAN